MDGWMCWLVVTIDTDSEVCKLIEKCLNTRRFLLVDFIANV